MIQDYGLMKVQFGMIKYGDSNFKIQTIESAGCNIEIIKTQTIESVGCNIEVQSNSSNNIIDSSATVATSNSDNIVKEMVEVDPINKDMSDTSSKIKDMSSKIKLEQEKYFSTTGIINRHNL